MPRHQEPMKDVANDDMLRGAVSKHGSGDFRMGKPSCRNGQLLIPEYIGYKMAYEGN
jgi:hypothetical protein